jgi:hypothetical protein
MGWKPTWGDDGSSVSSWNFVPGYEAQWDTAPTFAAIPDAYKSMALERVTRNYWGSDPEQILQQIEQAGVPRETALERLYQAYRTNPATANSGLSPAEIKQLAGASETPESIAQNKQWIGNDQAAKSVDEDSAFGALMNSGFMKVASLPFMVGGAQNLWSSAFPTQASNASMQLAQAGDASWGVNPAGRVVGEGNFVQNTFGGVGDPSAASVFNGAGNAGGLPVGNFVQNAGFGLAAEQAAAPVVEGVTRAVTPAARTIATSALGKLVNGDPMQNSDWLSLAGTAAGAALSVGSAIYGLSLTQQQRDAAKSALAGIVPPQQQAAALAGSAAEQARTEVAQAQAGTVGSQAFAMQSAEQAAAAAKLADPWGEYRADAAKRLDALSRDPSSITSDPGYEAGLEAVQRSLGAQGYQGSGNMMAALSKYGGDFYDKAIKRLSELAGVSISPVAAGQLGVQGGQLALSSGQLGIQGGQLGVQGAQTGIQAAQVGLQGGQLGLQGAQLNQNTTASSNDLASKSLASLGYGVTRALGGDLPSFNQPLVQR